MIDTFLSKLEKVTPKGRGKWVARCPAHGDKNPSLSITQTDDDRILIHCFSGCSVSQILDSIGLNFEDLYPKKLEGSPFKRGEKRPFSTAQIMSAFQLELLIAVQILGGFSRGDLLPNGTLELAGRTSENIARLAGELTR
jgi:hypothetical protein